MTKYTQADKIRHAIQQVSTEKARESSGFRRKFDRDDVLEKLDFSPSNRTLRDRMNTMKEQGYIKDAYGQGEFKPGDATVVATFPVPFKGEIDDREGAAQALSERGFEQIDAEAVDDDVLMTTAKGEFEIDRGRNPAEEVASQANSKLAGLTNLSSEEVTIEKVI